MSTVLVQINDHIATITINKPEVLNALSTAVLADLNQALDEVEKVENIYAVILTGAGVLPLSPPSSRFTVARADTPTDPFTILIDRWFQFMILNHYFTSSLATGCLAPTHSERGLS